MIIQGTRHKRAQFIVPKKIVAGPTPAPRVRAIKIREPELILNCSDNFNQPIPPQISSITKDNLKESPIDRPKYKPGSAIQLAPGGRGFQVDMFWLRSLVLGNEQ